MTSLLNNGRVVQIQRLTEDKGKEQAQRPESACRESATQPPREQ